MSDIKVPIIIDDQRLVAAVSRSGHPIPVYDDGWGPLFIHQNSMGISGIVRAQKWSDAYTVCEDEFFPEADKTVEELTKEYGFIRKHVKIIKVLATGEERYAQPEDYPLDAVAPAWRFVRWETRETPDPTAWMDNELFQEAYGFRPNGPNERDTLQHGIYAKDLNGDSMNRLTHRLLEELGITLTIQPCE